MSASAPLSEIQHLHCDRGKGRQILALPDSLEQLFVHVGPDQPRGQWPRADNTIPTPDIGYQRTWLIQQLSSNPPAPMKKSPAQNTAGLPSSGIFIGYTSQIIVL